jgi:sialate O-acetylesterase
MYKKNLLSLLALLVLLPAAGFCKITLPAIFGDNMVLQRDVKVPIWGWADAGEQILIEFQNKVFKTQAGTDGKWNIKLSTYHAGGPYQMLLKTNKEQVMLKNILIGDVWVASGQSNMELGIQAVKGGAEAIANATDTLIHFFYVPMTYALQPKNDIGKTAPESPNGKWVVCSPQVMANPNWAWHGITGVGYFFAQQIRKTQGCPVGLIATYKGGTPAQAWVSMEGLQKDSAFTTYVAKHQALVDHLAEAQAAYPQQAAAYKEALAKWNEEIGKDFNIAHKQWEADVALAKASGQPRPVEPKPAQPAPKSPGSPEGGFNAPANLYNAMIAPIIPYGMKGVIWYQGESNGDSLPDAVAYKALFPRLITDWRDKWKQGNFPFFFVQLPNFRAPAVNPTEGNWAWVREAQLKTLSLPKTGMAVTMGIGETQNIHPLNKQDVGLRLALAARHLVYGENVVYSGPVYQSMKVEGNKIRIKFDFANNGLKDTTTTTELKGFAIAGADQKFVWAKAVIEGNTIVISADEVTNPVAVRYDWADNPAGRLAGNDGLPVSPFRTDNWAPPIVIAKTSASTN